MECKPNNCEVVSVIMPVFNAGNGQALKEAVYSILNQINVDLKLYICDDASSDNTIDIIERLARSDQRIVVLRNEKNKKAGAARNKCIKASKGEFVALMDADDISSPNRLIKQIVFLQERPDVAFVGTKGKFFGDDITPDNYWFVRKPEKKDFLMTLPFVNASIVFRREVLEAVGGYCEKKYAYRSEDYELLMRLYSKGYYGENLDEPLYFIRVDEGTYCRRKYRYRLNETAVKLKGYLSLGLMPIGLPFALKPLVVGLIPNSLLHRLKKAYYKDR